MSFRVGDAVFGVNGIPGVVKSQDKVTGDVEVDVERSEVEKVHKHGYINGLSQNERKNFFSHLEEVENIEDQHKKIEAMRDKIKELKQDPKQIKMVRYLESQLYHFMSSSNISPRMYTMETPTQPVK